MWFLNQGYARIHVYVQYCIAKLSRKEAFNPIVQSICWIEGWKIVNLIFFFGIANTRLTSVLPSIIFDCGNVTLYIVFVYQMCPEHLNH
jgi:hypothetical protein